MKPEAIDILELMKNDPNLYVLLVSTDIDTNNELLLRFFKNFHGISTPLSKEEMTDIGDGWFTNELTYGKIKGLVAWQSTLGYWGGRIQQNSYILLIDSFNNINKTVCELQANLAQDVILVFKANAPYKKFNKPVNYCTKVDNFWIMYNLEDSIEISCPLFESKNNKKFSKNLLEQKKDDALENFIDLSDGKLDREKVSLLAYSLAPRYFNTQAFSNSIINVDDFSMEVASLILEMWDNGELEYLTTQNVIPKLRWLIKTNIFNTIRRDFRKDYPDLPLDKKTKVHGSETSNTYLDYISPSNIVPSNDYYIPWTLLDKNITPNPKGTFTTEEIIKAEEELAQEGKQILKKVLLSLPTTPYSDKKHGQLPVSERTIATLLLNGVSTKDIVKEFLPATTIKNNQEVDPRDFYPQTTGIGTRLNKLVLKVKEDLQKALATFPDEDRWTLYEYLIYLK